MQERQSINEDCLALLRERGGVWFVGCGWQWRNSATATAIAMRTLERRGLVERCVTRSRVEWRLRTRELGEPCPVPGLSAGASARDASACAMGWPNQAE